MLDKLFNLRTCGAYNCELQAQHVQLQCRHQVLCSIATRESMQPFKQETPKPVDRVAHANTVFVAQAAHVNE